MQNYTINHKFIEGHLLSEPTPIERQTRQLAESMSREIIHGIHAHFTRQRVGKIILNTLIGAKK